MENQKIKRHRISIQVKKDKQRRDEKEKQDKEEIQQKVENVRARGSKEDRWQEGDKVLVL